METPKRKYEKKMEQKLSFTLRSIHAGVSYQHLLFPIARKNVKTKHKSTTSLCCFDGFSFCL